MKTKLNHKDILEKYQLLTELMDNIPDVVYFKDKRGRLLWVNKAHARGLGLNPGQVVGKTDFDFFPKARARQMAKDDARVFRSGKPIIDKVERATRADGIDNYVTTTKIPRLDAKGQVIGLIGITRDITRRMRLDRQRGEEATLKKKLQTLEELNKLKSEFISLVSHELRTPLAIVKEGVSLVFEGIAGEITQKQKGILTKAKSNIERLDRIIADLLEISRIERGRLKLHYSLVDFKSLIRDSSEFFRRQAQEKGITLEYRLPKQEINMFIDAERINQVISNLITNAIKFTEEGGRILVEVQILEDKVRVGVIDTGVGIAKEDMPRLFHKFVQVSKVATAEKKGLGLGLSIAKELVERSGGEIWAESRLGVDSKFYFTLPRYYTLAALDNSVRDRLNQLLVKDASVYLVNLLIINYKEFIKRMKIGPKDLFKNIRSITQHLLDEIFGEGSEKPQIGLLDSRRGECCILLPEAKEKHIARFCNLLKEKLNSYLSINRLEDVFIAIGMMPYSRKGGFPVAKELPVNILIKEIYIGAEMRRHKRIQCRLDIKVGLQGKPEPAETLDISQGGMCFVSPRAFKADEKVDIRLTLSPGKVFQSPARVAWIRKLYTGSYKVGLEFTNLKGREKKALAGFLRSLTKKEKA